MEGGPGTKEGYTLTVQREIVVQEGLCVLVPCNFSYPKEKWTDSHPILRYWFQRKDKISDPAVVTDNPKKSSLEKTQGRFFLLEDPWKNNCSLDIREIRKEDEGSYYFRMERGKLKFSYIGDTMTLRVTGQTWAVKRPLGKVMGTTGLG